MPFGNVHWPTSTTPLLPCARSAAEMPGNISNLTYTRRPAAKTVEQYYQLRGANTHSLISYSAYAGSLGISSWQPMQKKRTTNNGLTHTGTVTFLLSLTGKILKLCQCTRGSTPHPYMVPSLRRGQGQPDLPQPFHVGRHIVSASSAHVVCESRLLVLPSSAAVLLLVVGG